MRRPLARVAAIALPAALAVAGAAPRVPPRATRAFTHVAVVDVEGGRVLPDRTVLIDGNRIRGVGPSAELTVPAGARVVEARGRFLIPGLWDMHVHARRLGRAKWMFPLFVATGVTGIRDTGSPVDSLVQYRARVLERAALGPRIGGAGPILDGEPMEWPELSLPVGAPAVARQVVDSLARAGVDFIKIYNGLSREAFFAITDEAKRRGVPVIGHVPRSVTALEASEAGVRSLEHMTRVPPLCVPDSVNRTLDRAWGERSSRPGMTMDSIGALQLELAKRAAAAFDETLCERVGARFASNGTWQTPTLERNLRWAPAFLASDTAGTDTLLRYVPAAVRRFWREYRDSARVRPQPPAGLEELGYRTDAPSSPSTAVAAASSPGPTPTATTRTSTASRASRCTARSRRSSPTPPCRRSRRCARRR